MKENSKQSIVICLRRTYPIWRTIKTFSDVLGICIYWTSTNNLIPTYLHLQRSRHLLGYLVLHFIYTSTNANVTETWLRTESILFYGGGSWTYARQQTAPVFIAWATLFIRSYFFFCGWLFWCSQGRWSFLSLNERQGQNLIFCRGNEINTLLCARRFKVLWLLVI